MTRQMYDSVTARDIPLSATMVAGYINGTYQWSAADWTRFPHATTVRIATRASVNDGHVLDVEPGDATPAQAPAWVLRRRAAGVDPSIYCNELNTWPTVINEFIRQGVPQPHYWVARYNNTAANRVIPAGAVAKQWGNPVTHGQGHFDLSTVADYWPGVDPPNDGGFFMALTDAEQREMRDRIMGFLRQRYFIPDPDNPNGVIEVTADTPGAQPATALDSMDGNFIVNWLMLLDSKVAALENGVDYARLAQAMVDDVVNRKVLG